MKLFLSMLASCAVGSAAVACPGPFAERHVFFKNPPKKVPAGMRAVRVRVINPGSLDGPGLRPAIVEVLASPRTENLPVRPQAPFNSCGRWGYVNGPAYVLGTLQRGEHSGPVFVAQLVGAEIWAAAEK